MDIRIKRFLQILELQAESYDHVQQLHIADKVIEMYIEVNGSDDLVCTTDDNNNVYIVKGKPPKDDGVYPCVVAHLDQVHKVKDFYQIHVDDDVIFAVSKNKFGEYCQVGTGSDDLAGVWLALELLLANDYLKVAFFLDEEVGCLGSEVSDINFFSDCSFVLQGDRRSKTNDFIVFTNGVKTCSKEFKKEVYPTLSKFNYKANDGIATDVGQLVINGIGCCAANISCGYFNEHTDQEISFISLSLNCLDLMQALIDNHSYKRWPMAKPKVTPSYRKKNDSFDLFNNINPDEFEDVRGPFFDMPKISSEERNSYTSWTRYCNRWSEWATLYFPKYYGKDRFKLNFPSPWSFNELQTTDFEVAVIRWENENRLPKKEKTFSFKKEIDCPLCLEYYSVASKMQHYGNGLYYCHGCGTDIDITALTEEEATSLLS